MAKTKGVAAGSAQSANCHPASGRPATEGPDGHRPAGAVQPSTKTGAEVWLT